MTLVNEIDALLPQTQCGECGYPGCLPYAQALATQQAPINRCPPGGIKTIEALAKKLHIPVTAELTTNFKTRPPAMAKIHESECIGCTKCIQACPVDAIMGSASQMHVILETECTGCGLCIEPCPVDCIELNPIDTPAYDHQKAKERFKQKQIRQLRYQEEQARMYREKNALTIENDDKKAYILEALKRNLAKKNAKK